MFDEDSEFPRLRNGEPALVLAPMEGVTDAPMRAVQAESGAFRYCVTEFLRVSQEIPPPKVFFRHVPELRDGCRTVQGVPVQIQLLGGDPEKMAATAFRAWTLGATAIDLNFGCPAPTVNRNDGGATLLKYPDRLRGIVAAVRAALPEAVPVSAKLRLGWDSLEAIHRNAEEAAAGGASWITIHGRTRVAGYAPPAYWKPIGEVRRALSIPVVANGDIWTLDDFRRCRDESGCEHFMLGRGALADPSLPVTIARELGIAVRTERRPLGDSADAWLPLLRRFADLQKDHPQGAFHIGRRMKQWLKFSSLRGEITWFDEVKRAADSEAIFRFLETRAAQMPSGGATL